MELDVFDPVTIDDGLTFGSDIDDYNQIILVQLTPHPRSRKKQKNYSYSPRKNLIGM